MLAATLEAASPNIRNNNDKTLLALPKVWSPLGRKKAVWQVVERPKLSDRAGRKVKKVKQLLQATDEVAQDGCCLAATVLVNLERGSLKDDEHGTLRQLAHNVLRQDPNQQNAPGERPGQEARELKP